MNRPLIVMAIATGAVLAACSQAKVVSAHQVLAAAKENAIRAKKAYEGKVEVTGVVVDMGLYRVDSTVQQAKLFGEVVVPRYVLREGEWPYLVLESDVDHSLGRFYCFFNPNKVDEASRPEKGSVVTLRAVLDSVEYTDKSLVTAYLCRVAEQDGAQD